jgi:uncharacterized protein (DUF1778 family)
MPTATNRTGLVRDARHVLREQQVTILSDRDREVFLSMLAKPPQPNEALRKAAAAYRRLRGNISIRTIRALRLA